MFYLLVVHNNHDNFKKCCHSLMHRFYNQVAYAWSPLVLMIIDNSNKSNVYKYHQKKTRYKILQQDQGLLDRTLRISIRWRKIVANQLEIHLLSSPVLLCKLDSAASIAVILSILSLAATCGTRSVLLRVARPISQPRLELTGLPVC